MGVVDIEMGGKDFAPVDMQMIFLITLNASASKIILVHIHPSEITVTSSHDIALTKKAVDAVKMLEIEVCCHILVSEDEGSF